MENTDGDFKPSSLSQRIRALESAGITDKFVKKRIPSYAAEAATIGSQISQSNRNFQLGNQTKIYQNPSNHFEPPNFNNISINSSIYSNENNAKIYRSNSVDSIEQNSDIDTTNENSDTIVREDRITSPVNYHHIISELNEAKSRLRKVPEPPVSPLNVRRLGNVIDTNTSQNNQQSPKLQDTSFSRATSKLLAESVKRNASNLTSNNDLTSSMNQIPISIPLNGSPIPPSLSRSSTPGGIASLVNIFHDVNKHSSNVQASEKSRSLMNIFDATNQSRASENNMSIRSDYSYNKYVNTSPRPYQNPIGSISGLKNIAQEVLDSAKFPEPAEDSISMRSMRSSVSSQNIHHQPTIIQHNSHRSSLDSRGAHGKQYVSQYTARSSYLETKNSSQLTSSANDLLNTTPFRAPSYEQLESNDYTINRPSLTKKSESPSLYDEYLNSNQAYASVNSVNNERRKSSSVSSNNTMTGVGNNYQNVNVNSNNQRSSSNSRSHLVSGVFGSWMN